MEASLFGGRAQSQQKVESNAGELTPCDWLQRAHDLALKMVRSPMCQRCHPDLEPYTYSTCVCRS